MKKSFVFLLAMLTQWGWSQTAKDVGDFNSLIVFDKINATLIPSESSKVELSGSGHQEVELINKNGQLKVKMNLKNTLQGDEVKAVIYYKNLDEIIADEGAQVHSEYEIKNVALKTSVKKGARMILKVNVDRLDTKGHTGGLSQISGSAKFQDILSNSGASIHHKNLKTEQTDVTVNAGGQAEVYASELVDAKTRAGGKILIYGNPKSIQEKTVAGGSIQKVN